MSIANRLARWYMVTVDALDLGGSDGRLSFQKGVLLLVLFLGAFATLGTTLGIAVLAASFGRTVFVGFLKRGQFSASDSTVRQKVTKTVKLAVARVHRTGEDEPTAVRPEDVL